MNIIHPIITEKMNKQGGSLNKYGFVVRKEATKHQIKKDVEKLYGVQVIDVNTFIKRGKRKSRNTKGGILRGKESSYKKAIITVAEGSKIDFYSNI